MDESTGMAEEMALMKEELHWLLDREEGEINSVFKEILNIMKECKDRLIYRPDVGETVDECQSEMSYSAPLTTEGDSITGIISVTGQCVTKASLQLHGPLWNKGEPFTTQIDPTRPWILTQVENAANFLRLVEKTIGQAQRKLFLLEEYQEKRESADQTYMQEAANFVLQTLNQSMTLIGQAKSQLLGPTNRTPATLGTELTNQGVLQPRLPSNVIVDFYVDYGNLVTAVYALSQSNSSSVQRHTNQCKVGNLWYDVDDVIVLDRPIPSLAKSLALVNTAYELCQCLCASVAVVVASL